MSLHDQPHTPEEKAVDATSVLGFEALYQTDDDTFQHSKYSDGDRDESVTTGTSSAGDSVFGLDIMFSPGEHDIANTGFEKDTPGEESDASKRTVAWFHQQRVQKNKNGKVKIVMALDEEVEAPTPSKTSSIGESPEETSPKNNQNQNPDPLLNAKAQLPGRRTIRKRMKEWLWKGTSVRDSPMTFEDKTSNYVEPVPSLSVGSPEEEVAPESKKTHRLTIVSSFKVPVVALFCSIAFLQIVSCFEPIKTLRKRREPPDEGSSACCLLVDEVLDLGYFWQCLGEDFKEEGLRYTGFAAIASRDDENSVVENNITTSKEEERTTYSV